MNNSETNPSAATTLKELQQVAQNQIQFKIWGLEERLKWLKSIKSQAQIETVVDWESYERLIGNIDEDDNRALTALNILGNEAQTIRKGDYF